MRWVAVILILCNMIFFLKNWLEFDHSRNIAAMNASLGQSPGDLLGMQLVLLGERKNSKTAAVSTAVGNDNIRSAIESNVIEDLASRVANICILLGPYQEIGSARKLIDQLAAMQIQAKYASIRILGDPDYWVYLVPEKTRELATAKLRELQEKKIDSFIIPQGDDENGISLGVFDNRESAEKRQQSIIALGYDAKLRSNARTYIENWVIVYSGQESKLKSGFYEQLRLENKNLEVRKERCDMVASIQDIQ